MSHYTSITCPVCDMTSHNPTDVREGYCGNCRDWTSAPVEQLRRPERRPVRRPDPQQEPA